MLSRIKLPVKKLKNGFELPVYGLGLWQMGGRWEADASQDEQEITAIRAALDAGITHIDTAESYGNGHAEELLCRALSKTSNLEHLRENLGALDWTMEDQDAERLRREFPDQKAASDAVPLGYEASAPA